MRVLARKFGAESRVPHVGPVRVLILGGGFGGVAVAQELERLARQGTQPIDVTLVSRVNYLLFVPMLAEAAAGRIEPTHILSPLRRLLGRTRIRVECVQGIDLAGRTVTTVNPSTQREHVLPWDHLVIALGNVVNLTSLPGVAEHGLPIKSVDDALCIRDRALEMLEAAEHATDPGERRQLLTFVVAGGGYSGVEVAAELNDFVHESRRVAYPSIDPADVRVVLLHSGRRILPELSAGLAEFAHHTLTERGVDIRLGARLAAATAEHVVLQGGERVEARTLVVAIGSGPNPVVEQLGAPLDRGRIVVDPMLRVAGQSSVWAVGDCAAVPLPRTGQPAPPTAQFALREGKTVARNVMAVVHGRAPRPFGFTGLGEMVSLGHRSGVAELLGRLRVSGLPAWMLWRAFYLACLPGLKQKLRVWLDWNLELFFPRDVVQLNVQHAAGVAYAHFEPGQEIYRQGDPPHRFYVIARGTVQIVRDDGDRQVEVARLREGDSFGEAALLQHRRRAATVRAVEPVDVIALDRRNFNVLTRTWKHLGHTLQEVSRIRTGAGVARPIPPSPARGRRDGVIPWSTVDRVAADRSHAGALGGPAVTTMETSWPLELPADTARAPIGTHADSKRTTAAR